MMRIFTAVLMLTMLTLSGCGINSGDVSLRECLKLAAGGKEKDLKKALEQVERIRGGIEQPNQQVFELEALCLTRLAEYHRALDVSRDGLEHFPGSFILNYVMGQANYMKANYTEAVPKLQTSVQLNPESTDARLLLALAARRADHIEAGTYFESLTQMDQFRRDSFIYNEWAIWLLRRGRSREALEKLIETRTFGEVPPVIYRNIAVIFDGDQVQKAAHRYYQMYLEALPAAESEDRAKVQARLERLAY